MTTEARLDRIIERIEALRRETDGDLYRRTFTDRFALGTVNGLTKALEVLWAEQEAVDGLDEDESDA